MYNGKSAALVLIQAMKHLALSVVTGDNSTLAHILSASNKNLSGGQETRQQQFWKLGNLRYSSVQRGVKQLDYN